MTMDLGTLAILFPMLFSLLGLGFTVVIDPYIQQKQRRIMLLIVVLCLGLIVQNLWENELFVSHSHLALKNLLSAYGYSVRPVFLVLFLSIVWPEGKMWPAWTLAGINAALYFSSPFTKLCFEIREFDFAALQGPLWFSCILVSGVLLLELLIRTILRYREMRRLEQLIPVSVALIIAASVALDMNVGMAQQPVAFLTIAIVVGSLFYYIWLHLQFVREHERDLMAAQRIKIMISQIQPHFLYNTLAAIQDMCLTEPRLAAETIGKFGLYLRQNLESLEMPGLISFEREIEHTRTYTDIEQKRFGNLQVDYSIEDGGFCLPALTVQPLVENAIRHGVRKRDPGVVSIAARRETDAHLITVRDNGVGFDVSAANEAGNDHIGIRNVRDRLEKLCGGTLRLDSRIGEGTVAEIRIPVRENEEETPCE